MTQHTPPRWLERTLLWCLPERDRETISGDLLEEYREEKVPHLGSFGARVWYLRQWVSFLSIRSFGGSPALASLTWMSGFTASAGAWLAMMEIIQKHAGYSGRAAIAAGITVHSLVTVLCLVLERRSVLRIAVLTGALGAVLLGSSALQRIPGSRHFEGFVLVIGSALILQGVLAIVVLLRTRRSKTI